MVVYEKLLFNRILEKMFEKTEFFYMAIFRVKPICQFYKI